MRGGDSDDATDDELGAPAGGFAARRYKAARAEIAEPRRTGGGGGDDLEDDFDLSGDEGNDDEGSDGEGGDGGGDEGSDGDGDGPLQKRQRRRAAGGDELQSSFRCAFARGGVWSVQNVYGSGPKVYTLNPTPQPTGGTTFGHGVKK